MKIGVYPGSFDPVTNGHLAIIEAGSKLFDKVVVAVAINPEKKYMFTAQERLDLVKNAVKGYSNVGAMQLCDGELLGSYFGDINHEYCLIKGLRTPEDFTYEKTMRHINSTLFPGMETFFYIPPKEVEDISSSMVKGLTKFTDWQRHINKFVPRCVVLAMIKKVEETRC